MADYKTIKGFNIQSVSSDPSNLSEGEIWYNTTSSTIKGYATQAGTWSSGTAYPQGIQAGAGSAGIATALIVWGGDSDAGGPGYVKDCFSYNGSAWTATNAMNRDAGAYEPGLGTQTAALAGCYYRGSPAANVNAVEEFDGTNWTEVNSMVNDVPYRNGNGTQTAGIMAGGKPIAAPSGAYQDVSETYDGTSWTEGNNLNTARSAGCAHNGTSTACLTVGGRDGPGSSANTELYDGTCWTEVNNLNTARYFMGGSGTSTLALTYGGLHPPKTETESWDGTSWTEVNDLSAGRGGGGSGGTTNTSAVMASGGEPYNSAVEEWTTAVAVVTFTAS